jgi:hypothetical protein
VLETIEISENNKYKYTKCKLIRCLFISYLVLIWGFSGVRVNRSLLLCICFVDRCLYFCPFSLVYSSSIYGFWLPLWYRQAILIVMHFYTDVTKNKAFLSITILSTSYPNIRHEYEWNILTWNCTTNNNL